LEKHKVVAEASVVAKWFLDEEFSEEALLLRDSLIAGKLTIAVPTLIFYEVLNAMRYSRLYNADELVTLARSLSKYGFEVWDPKGELYERTAKLGLESGVSIYDASYIALANLIKSSLYTADNNLVAKFPETARHIKTFKA
jgi:predicted nucleic acid-binding protein